MRFFDRLGFRVIGVDNNMRADFFGPGGDTTQNRDRLLATCKDFTHFDLDIRDREAMNGVIQRHEPDLVIHAAAQPSHDLAARRPFDDYDVNAVGTLNLLESCRRRRPDAVFIHISTNKVYGDGPNSIALREEETRFEFDDPAYEQGIAEDFPVDHRLHSLYGASKLSADLLAQEYGRNFGLRTGVFRAGCITGPQHAGVEQHGFLNYLVKRTLGGSPYRIFGYKGKQVRDQIHSLDLVEAFWRFAQDPRPGEVYNIGGGGANAASLMECVDLIESITGRRPRVVYDEKNRLGDHICYYTDLSKFRAHYPGWELTRDLESIIEEMVTLLTDRSGSRIECG